MIENLPGLAEAQMSLHPPREGMSTDQVDAIVAGGRLSMVELDRLAIPRKTLAHRRIFGSLTLEQSDRVRRLVRMIIETECTFDSETKAHTWLRRPNALLGGETPLNRLDTDAGTKQVETLLMRIDHGIAA
jgi:putative toxin-antitoxin system antitoxin component (TIGR02293 family)